MWHAPQGLHNFLQRASRTLTDTRHMLVRQQGVRRPRRVPPPTVSQSRSPRLSAAVAHLAWVPNFPEIVANAPMVALKPHESSV